MSTLTAPNGAMYNIPDDPGAKAEFTRSLLDSLVSPYVTPSVMDANVVNNFVTGTDPLSGSQQSALLGLDVVMTSPEQVDSIAQRLSDTSGGNKVDWIALITGLWNTAKNSNVLGTSRDQQRIEGDATQIVGAVAAESITRRIACFLRENALMVVVGFGVFTFIVYSCGKRR